ncbi:hypothetical protein HZB05_01710 [Candidatus Wolfebacteria bacterium]|nr:hypothetical protein [Candidatus Wolfebacteria bacterium]
MKRLVLIGLVIAMFFAIGCNKGGRSSNTTSSPPSGYDYTTTTHQVASQNVNAATGGIIQVTDSTSSIVGLKLTIPAGVLSNDTNVTVGEVSNPPALPLGLNYVGTPIDLEPSGTTFSQPATIEIPFFDAALSDAGVASKAGLKVYYFDKSTETWAQATVISIDTVNNVVTAEVNHFSFIQVTGGNGLQPQDIGRPQPGDLLYKLTFEGLGAGWRPGHVGIYTGEKEWLGDNPKHASDDVKRCGKYNVIEALWDGVQYSYYNIPNTAETCSVTTGFEHNSIYMGAREPNDDIGPLTQQQRDTIVSYVESQIGNPYAKIDTTLGALFGMAAGSAVKGQDLFHSFNCVGLAEAAYEAADVNGGRGLVSLWNEEVGLPPALTPAEQYMKTKPAQGVDPIPTINWAILTPDSGTDCTEVLVQISVSHTYGLSYIDSVTYITDDGYTNPNLYINDDGIDGDITAGDGTYSVSATAGGDPAIGSIGLTFTVTDKSSKPASIRLVYTYTGSCGLP